MGLPRPLHFYVNHRTMFLQRCSLLSLCRGVGAPLFWGVCCCFVWIVVGCVFLSGFCSFSVVQVLWFRVCGVFFFFFFAGCVFTEVSPLFYRAP